jgi:uncharacterized protein (TIGR02284 family)
VSASIVPDTGHDVLAAIGSTAAKTSAGMARAHLQADACRHGVPRRPGATTHSRGKDIMEHRDLIDTLNRLVETCKDGEYGFRSCAEHCNSEELKRTFSSRAEDCRQGAVELQALIRQNGGEPDDGGSTTGAVHRGWVAVKGTLSGYSDLAMLEECERGEDAALERYRKALEESLPPDARSVVERQFEGVKKNHLQIRTLRDQMRASQS